MIRTNPQIRNFAERLVVYETGGDKKLRAKPSAAFDGCEKLRPQLVTLMGNGGYRALLGRALALAGVELPWLRMVHVNADASLAGLEEFRTQLDPVEFFEGGVLLLSRLLGLLVTFIGENLTLRLMHQIWPDIPLNDLAFDDGNQREKAK